LSKTKYFVEQVKRCEANLNELKLCSEEFEHETECLKQNCSHLIKQNKQQIEELIARVNFKQVQLDTVLSENLDYLSTRFQVDVSQLRQSSECLVDALRAFNSQLTGNNTATANAAAVNKTDLSYIMPGRGADANATLMMMNNFTVNANNTQFRPKPQKQAAGSGCAALEANENHVRLNQMESFLNFDSQAKAKCFILGELVKNFVDLDKMLGKLLLDASSSSSLSMNYSSNDLVEFGGSVGQTTNALCGELDVLLEKCVKSDRAIAQAYLETIKSKLAQFNEQNEYLAKV
jgi:hypothetical protein